MHASLVVARHTFVSPLISVFIIAATFCLSGCSRPQQGRAHITLAKGRGEIAGACFSPDGQNLAIVRADGTVSITSLKEEGTKLERKCPGGAVAVCCVEKENVFHVMLWNYKFQSLAWKDLSVVRELELHTAGVMTLAVDTQNNRIAVSDKTDHVRVFDVATKPREIKKWGTGVWVRSIALSRDGRFLAFPRREHGIRVWEPDAKSDRVIGGDGNQRYGEVAFLGNSYRMAVGRDYNTVVILDAETGKEIGILGTMQGPTALCSSHDGKLVAAGSGGRIQVWRVPSAELVANWYAHDAVVIGLVFSPDGMWLASSCSDIGLDDKLGSAEVKVWKLDVSGKE